ncbi:MAG TPA: CAP domain-containing protein [Candidatus Elarobacter sp.]|nr:CAP domain-containing protein [Candidatus Elarobacter sp.]
MVDDSGSPVAGAAVYVGGNLPPGPSPVTSSYGAVSTTAADGSFNVTGVQGVNSGPNYDPAHMGYTGTWIVVWPKDSALPIYHAARVFANTAVANALGTITLVRLSATDLQAIASMNSYRASQGSGALYPDEIEAEAARMWAAYVNANPGTGHSCPTSDPSCVSAQGYENAHGGERGAAENLGPGSQWSDDIGEYESEAANCPQPTQYASCAAYENQEIANGQLNTVGHWVNLVNPSAVWIGVGSVPDTQPGGAGAYVYDAEFGGP